MIQYRALKNKIKESRWEQFNINDVKICQKYGCTITVLKFILASFALV